MIRDEIQKLVSLGPLPNEKADIEHIQACEKLLLSISGPVTDDEAKLLARLFGPDSCFGLAWHLVHLIESAPSWPIVELLQDQRNEWIQVLRQSAENAGKLPK